MNEIDTSFLPSGKELTPNNLSREIVRRKKPINFKEMIGKSQILGLGEEHWNSQPAKHIAKNAEYFVDLGITHYCIEASVDIQPQLDKLNSGQAVDLSRMRLGVGTHQGDYEDAVVALAKNGVKIIAVDIQEPRFRNTQKVREDYIFTRVQKNLGDESKLLILIGKGHLLKHLSRNSKPAWLGQLLEADNISISTAAYVVGNTTPAFQDDPTMVRALQRGNLLQDEFMVDTKGFYPWDSDQLYKYEADYWIHLNEKVN